jgi:hypothetical protein
VTARTSVPRLGVLLLYVALATSVGFSDYHARTYPDLGFTQYGPEVVGGTAEPPGRYRVLAPYLFDALSRATPFAPVTDWLMFRWFCLLAALLAGHLYLRTWFDDAHAVMGNVLVMALLPLTFTNSWPNPDHFTELVLFTLACAAVARRAWPEFLILVALNAFNRETSAFLVLLWFVSGPVKARSNLMQTAAAGLLWAAITVALRWRLGYVAYDPWQIWQNIGWLTPLPAGFIGYKRIYGWFFIILLGPLFLLALRSWREQPRFTQVAASIVAPLYLLVACLFSSTIESRIFTALLPLLVPSVLFTLFPASGSDRAARPAGEGV